MNNTQFTELSFKLSSGTSRTKLKSCHVSKKQMEYQEQKNKNIKAKRKMENYLTVGNKELS